MPIRIVLADDDYLVREGVRRLLELHPDLEVAAVCGDLDALLAAVERRTTGCRAHGHPDAAGRPRRRAPGRRRLRDTHPDIGVIVLSQYAEPGYALALSRPGQYRRAYLLKERVDDLDQLVAAIRAVAGGGSVVDPKVIDGLVAAKARAKESAPPTT